MKQLKKFSSIFSIKKSQPNNLNFTKMQFSQQHIWGNDKNKDIEMFKINSNKIVEDIIEFNKNISEKRVVPDVKPNFLKSLLLIDNKPLTMQKLNSDLKNHIFPNMTLWNHPRFLNWYPSITSFPAILGNIISNSIENPSRSFNLNSSGNELESWLVKQYSKILNLPFTFQSDKSGGYVNFAVGEVNVISALAAKKFKKNELNNSDTCKYVYYCSTHAHYSINKGINIAGSLASQIPIVFNKENNNYEINSEILEQTIKNDIDKGLIPAYIGATIGTTGTSGRDNIEKLSKIKKKYNIFLHVDAAYSGNVFMLEEYSYLLKGLEEADTIGINGNKWTPVSENSGWFFFKDKSLMDSVFTDNKIVSEEMINYELFSSRLNKSIRLYTVINTIGIEKFKEIIRRFLKASQIFKIKLEESGVFKILTSVEFALVCFNLGSKLKTLQFMNFINSEPWISIGPYALPNVNEDDGYILRISINYLYISEEDALRDSLYLINAYYRCFPNERKL